MLTHRLISLVAVASFAGLAALTACAADGADSDSAGEDALSRGRPTGPAEGTLGGKCREAAPPGDAGDAGDAGPASDCDPGMHCLIAIKWPTTPNGTPVTTKTCTDKNPCGTATCSGGAVCCNSVKAVCSDKLGVCPP